MGIWAMPEDQGNIGKPSNKPPCQRCGGDLKLSATLPTCFDHPTYEIFQCVACGFFDWVARPDET